MSWPWESKAAVDGRFYTQHPTVFTVARSGTRMRGHGFKVTRVFGDKQEALMEVKTAHLGNGNLRSLLLHDPKSKAPLLALEESRFGISGQRRWESFRGGDMKGTDRLFAAVDKTQLLQRGNTVHVFLDGNSSGERVPDLVVHGSYFWGTMTVSRGGAEVAHIRNECGRWARLGGANKYTVVIEPGVDQAFLLALIVILDQMHS